MNFLSTKSFGRALHRPNTVSVTEKLRQSMALARQRRQLAALDAHLLADIGLTRSQAEKEVARPSWDVPTHWRS